MRPLITIFFLLFAISCRSLGIYDTTIIPADVRTEGYLSLLKNKRVGLIINQTSVIGKLSLLDILLKKQVAVTTIFVPEHGFRGTEDAGAKVDNSMDSATGLPVISLYGKHKKPTAEDLSHVDVLLYDLQDVGVRFYTYISTMEYCMEACAENGKQFIVLDRPNPNGFYVDGPVLDTVQRSFVGMQKVPVVYGMTAGEYAQMLVGERLFNKANALDLKVIKCINYTHRKKFSLPVPPSPNLRSMAAIYAYPSLCLFEGTVVSVGRGTQFPFQQYGCPEFAGTYNYSFQPVSMAGAKKPPFEGETCYGEMVGKNEQEVLNNLNDGFRLGWLIKAYKAYPGKEKFFNSFFVKLAGTVKLQEQIKQGEAEEAIRDSWQKEISAFKKVRRKYLLYPDFE